MLFWVGGPVQKNISKRIRLNYDWQIDDDIIVTTTSSSKKRKEDDDGGGVKTILNLQLAQQNKMKMAR